MQTGVVFRHDLKVTSFFFDIINSIATHAVLLSGGNTRKKQTICLCVIGTLFAVVSLLQFIGKAINDYKEKLQDSHNKDRCKIIIMIVVNSFLLLCIWLCFLGDNINNFDGSGERIASIALLLIGLLGYRIISLMKEELVKVIPEEKEDNEETETENDEDNEETENDEEKEDCMLLLHTTIETLHIIPEIDGWYTHSTTLVSFGQLSTDSCSTGSITAHWIVYAIVLIAVIPHLYFVFHNTRKAAKKDFSKGFVIALCVSAWFIFVFFLIGDNNQPLDCSVAPNSPIDNIVRLVFLSISLVIYIGLIAVPALWWIKLQKRNKVTPTNTQSGGSSAT